MQKQILKIFFILVAFLTAPSFALAAPQISAPTPTNISNGQSITISGGNFGGKTIPAAPYFWDTVDNQSAYTGLVDGADVPVGQSNDPFASYMQGGGRGNTPTINKSLPVLPYRSSSYNCVDTQGYECGLNGLTKGIPYSNQAYFSWWIYPNYNISPTSSDKLIRLNHNCIDDSSDVQFVWTTNLTTGVYINGTGEIAMGGSGTWFGAGFTPSYNLPSSSTPTSWQFVEVLIDYNTQNITLYTNGTTIFSATLPFGSLATVPMSENISALCSIGLNNNEEVTGYENWGDIYMDTTFQRAELCPGSTWATRGQCTMLIPSAWSPTSITATVNQGSFSNGSDAYIYVVDQTNVANTNGFHVALGSGFSDVTAPAAPDGLQIQ